MDKPISAKELRTTLPDVVRRVGRGQRYVVLYRSRPAFRIVPIVESDLADLPLEDDPLYQAAGLASSSDGLTAEDVDVVLYGKPRR